MNKERMKERILGWKKEKLLAERKKYEELRGNIKRIKERENSKEKERKEKRKEEL